MPTYQYACTECGHQLEAVQSFSDPALTECPSCSGKLRKVFNSVGIVFKGSGFYRNDSRAGAVSADKPGASESPTPAKSESSSSSSSDSSSSSSTSSSSSPSTATKSSTSSAPTTTKAAAAS
ncbi:FmdB family zinc ribbon protein [Actinoplanes sp. NPDC051411]|uniref:FmdB family zinc ribbon protein n=1 Tax=Actinoplanes sp. NPDC051411 TaxID=3155522 RepID=UPI00341EAD3D